MKRISSIERFQPFGLELPPLCIKLNEVKQGLIYKR